MKGFLASVGVIFLAIIGFAANTANHASNVAQEAKTSVILIQSDLKSHLATHISHDKSVEEKLDKIQTKLDSMDTKLQDQRIMLEKLATELTVFNSE